MPDAITPVAAQIQPPSAQQGIGTLSGILGLQQQQQQLRSQTAAAQVAELGAQGQQEAAQFFKDWDPTQHQLSDGTTDIESAVMSPDFRNAGPGKTKILEGLLSIKQHQLLNKQALATLNGEVVTQLGKQAGALADDEDVKADKTDPATGINPGRAKLAAFAQNFASMSPDNARVVKQIMPDINRLPNKPGALAAAVRSIQYMGEDVTGQQAQQNPRPGFINTNKRILPTVTQPATGIPQFTGQSIDVEPGPTETPEYRGRVAAEVAARTGLGAGGAADINQHYAGVQAEAQRAETFTGIARNVQEFADKAITGTPAQRLNLMNGMLAYMGVGPAKDAKTASDLLQKNMAMLNLQGNVATDFKAMVTQMAQPHMEMSADAIKHASSQLIGQVQMKKAVGTALTKEYNHALATGDTDLYRAKRDAISNVGDARVWEFNSLSPKEQKEFRARLSPEDDEALGRKYKGAKALGLLQ